MALCEVNLLCWKSRFDVQLKDRGQTLGHRTRKTFSTLEDEPGGAILPYFGYETVKHDRKLTSGGEVGQVSSSGNHPKYRLPLKNTVDGAPDKEATRTREEVQLTP